MSVIVTAHVPEGIVIASDTRTTVKDGNGNTMYKDDAVKIVPFPNRIAVTHCGNALLTENLSVNEFLYDCRDKFGMGCRIFDLPSKLLCEYEKLNTDIDVIFLITGYGCLGRDAYTFKLSTYDKTISLHRAGLEYGASFSGKTDIVCAMLNNVDYTHMSLAGCKKLVSTSIMSTILSFEYRNPQSVGGHCDMYVLSLDDNQTGWIRNGKVQKDNLAPDNAYEQLMEEKVNQLMEKVSKFSKKKTY